MPEKTGRQIHADVEHTREAGDFWGSIRIAQDAVRAYIEEKDYLGLSEVYGSIALAFRHLYRVSNDKNFLVLAEGAAVTGIEIAKSNKREDGIALPTFNLAKTQEELGQFKKAGETYVDAINAFKANPPSTHNRKGVLADMEIHLYICQYKAGDKKALPKVLNAIEDLKKSDEKTVGKYNYDVWLSGAYMKLAEILKDDDKDLAKKYLEEAKNTINSNQDLKLRKEQLEKLESNLNV